LRNRGYDRLAEVYAVLGIYEKAAALDARLLRNNPEQQGVRRRRVWSLLRLGRYEEADQVAEALRDSRHPLSKRIAWVASEVLLAPGDPEREAWIARLPLLTPPEAMRLRAMIRSPLPAEPRPVRREISPN
jgi:tetratricopeptide (TPR) repeat protein